MRADVYWIKLIDSIFWFYIFPALKHSHDECNDDQLKPASVNGVESDEYLYLMQGLPGITAASVDVGPQSSSSLSGKE